MKKVLGLSAIIFTLIIVQGLSAYTSALSTLTNIAIITAENSPNTPSYQTNLTVGTMYGGHATISSAPAGMVQTIANFGVDTWTIYVTNLGNSIASFSAVVVDSNVRPGGGTWSHHFSGLGALANLAPTASASFTFVITNVSAASNGSWMSYLVKITNTTAKPNAKAYSTADGTVYYGGWLGAGTNHHATNSGPVVYLQYASQKSAGTNASGFLTSIISGPVLSIIKSVVSVTHPSGLTFADGYAEPGALIQYRLFVTNTGSASATNTKIIDTFATNFLSLRQIDSQAGFHLDDSVSLPNGRSLVFTNDNKHLEAGKSGVITYTVRVR